ncbi:MAG: RluA family pseudouridine synthase [Candidatus Peribacteraceae bacterium]|jgi:RluA family pseudouridine synthase|nr:RluA family pseudouridine synthase [Candidatus Peribacteraceae bacterium]MDP7454156.1 RluA family pseudouridine synthase [Candidatus Peribacteraceae bacterium]MDP7646240.1 RluA family pseudouridine synthase [Candidatus Peribacteraceae bacterium]|tara:strand:+ start:391 stop:1017 length:627 start_codon:yes stop_codon:yes gene_type:complete
MSLYSKRILYEDDHLLGVNKLSCELVVKGRGKVQKLSLFDYLKKDYPGLKVLHRLDFETSGVVVFGKSKDTELIKAKKIYRTVVIGRMKNNRGVISKKLPARTGGEVEAMTRYNVLRKFKDASYVEAEIETGRHHQIRKHFASIGHPLVLDQVYGNERQYSKFSRRFRLKKFFLHAVRIEMEHPVTGKRIAIEAPMPKVFNDFLNNLA